MAGLKTEKNALKSGEKKGFLSANVKKLFFPVIILIGVLIVFFKLSELGEILDLFLEANFYFLILALLTQIGRIFAQAAIYKYVFWELKVKSNFNIFKYFKTLVTLTFLNLSIPSLNFAGNLWLFKKFKNHAEEGKILVAVLVEWFTFYLALIAMVFWALFYLFFRFGEIYSLLKIIISVFFGLFLFLIILVYFLFRDKKKAKKFFFWSFKKFRNLNGNKKRIEKLLEDFYLHGRWFKYNKFKLLVPIFFHILRFTLNALVIYLLFFAFGSPIYFGH